MTSRYDNEYCRQYSESWLLAMEFDSGANNVTVVPGDFVGPGSFHMRMNAYDYMVTSAVNIERPVTSVVNIEGHEADKWIVVRGKKNGSMTSYLLEPD